MLTALLFFLVLVVLIISHEFGHFLAAKLFGVQVDEFGLGFPPRIYGRQWGETLYSINWLPFGGFVKILGEDSEEAKTSDVKDAPTSDIRNPASSRSFTVQPAYKKIIILVAGVAGNLLLAWVLLTTSLQTGLVLPNEGFSSPEYFTNSRVVAGYVAKNSPAQKAGLRDGDTIYNTGIEELIKQVKESKGKPVTLEIAHAGKDVRESMAVVPELTTDGTYRIGVALDMVGEAHLPFFLAIAEGARMTVQLTGATISGLYQFVTGLFAAESSIGQVSGPVGIFTLVGSASNMGLAYVLAFMALLSINLAVLNILPIPALDGGRVLFIIVETVKGSPLKPDFIQKVHSAGFALLIMLMLAITAHDIVKLF